MHLLSRKYLSWLFALLVLVSCGMVRDKFGRISGGYTNVKISLPGEGEYSTMIWPSVSGGMMIYVVGTNGNTFSTTLAVNPGGGSTASTNILLPNGTYRFYGLAWAGPNPLETTVGCGSTPEYALTGTSTDVNLTISNSNAACGFTGGSIFANSGYNTLSSTNFPGLKIYACSGLTTISCATASSTFNTMASVKVYVTGYTKSGGSISTGGLTSFESVCYTGGNSYFTNALVPPGSTTLPDRFLGTTIAFYPNSNSTCSGSPTRTFFFPNGVANGSSDGASILPTSNLYIDIGS